MPGPYLEITTPDGRKQLPLGPQPMTVGRHADNKVVLADTMASRFHCVIEQRDGGWVVRDLNSSNGTLLDGRRITTSPLRPGQAVVIGSTRLVVVDPNAKSVRPPPPQVDEEMYDDVPDLSAIGDDEELDTLTEDDVVEVDDEPIHVDGGGDDFLGVNVGGRAPNLPEGGENARDYEQTLETLADSLPEKPFGEDEISMISARGQPMHPAKNKPGKRPKREAVDILRLIILICARSRSSDVHLEPKTDHFLLRIRMDGVMVDVTRLPNEMGVKLSALVKVLSDIDISQRTNVQEGHFAAKLPGETGGKSAAGTRRVDYRVSFAPVVFGQKLVIRVFDAANAPLLVNNLQLPEWMQQTVVRELQKEAGMLLVCGPTGSGKTTTLYALVRSSDVSHRNVVTIEDPVEVQIEGVTQMPVDESQGKTFSSLLRSVLRQDPDAILVGEIRDSETARIAMQAAITGHLVFSTVHTTSTIGTIFRLLDLGVEPYLIAQGLHVVIAQRLVRQLCPFCKKPVKPSKDEIERMGKAGEGVEKIYFPKGCPRCLGTGFAGRRAFFEMLRTTDELRDVITSNNRSTEEIKRVLGGKFITLEQAGYELVAKGLAPIDEIDQAVGKY
jgi:general secretion pathway protein E